MMMVLQFIKYEFIKYVLEVKNEVGEIKRELYKKARQLQNLSVKLLNLHNEIEAWKIIQEKVHM